MATSLTHRTLLWRCWTAIWFVLFHSRLRFSIPMAIRSSSPKRMEAWTFSCNFRCWKPKAWLISTTITRSRKSLWHKEDVSKYWLMWQNLRRRWADGDNGLKLVLMLRPRLQRRRQEKNAEQFSTVRRMRRRPNKKEHFVKHRQEPPRKMVPSLEHQVPFKNRKPFKKRLVKIKNQMVSWSVTWKVKPRVK